MIDRVGSVATLRGGRVLAPELMDDPSLDPTEHAHALRALATVNRLSFGARRVWKEITELHADGVAHVRVLDVACGGGDVLRDVWSRARRSRIPVTLHGCDMSEVALAVARGGAGGEAAVDFFRLDVLREALPSGYHLICSSLFLHHLEDGAAIDLLARMASATTHRVSVQDLRRSRTGYALAALSLRVLTRSRVARRDGPTSVRAAFTLEEAERLCQLAGLDRAEVRRCWPQRFTIRWHRAARTNEAAA